MTVVVGEAAVSVIPSARGFGRALQSQISRETSGVGVRTGKTFGAGFMASMKSFVGPLTAMFSTLAAANFAKQSIAEAREANKVAAETNARIKATGGVANVTAGHISALARSMMFKVGVDDEELKSSQNLLLSFRNIHNEAGRGNDIFDQAAKIAMDVSVAQKKALTPTTIALGKALDNPVKGLGLLSRYGIQFSKDQTEMIKAMVDSGRTMDAQKLILSALQARFGGVAAAQADATDKMTVAWGEVKEAVGGLLLKGLTPLMTFMASKALPAAESFFSQIQSGEGAVGKMASAVGSAVGFLGKFTGWLYDGRKILVPYLGAILAVVGAIKTWTIVQHLLNVSLLANPIGLIIAALVALGLGLVAAYNHSKTFRKIVDATFKAVAQVVKWAWTNVVQPAFKAWYWYVSKVLGPVLLWLWKHVASPVFKGIGTVIKVQWTVIRGVFSAMANFVTKTLPHAFSTGVNGVKAIWNGLVNIAKKPVNFVIGTVYNNGLRKVINMIGGVFGMKSLGTVSLLNSGGPVRGGRKHKDSVPALLTPDEHVWSEEEVKGAGGHKRLEALRALAKRGMLDRVGDLPRFAKGGYLKPDQIFRALQFARAQAGKPYIWGGVGPAGYDCSGFQSAITNVLRGQYPYRRLGTTATMPWPGFIRGTGQYTTGWYNGGAGGGHTAGTLAGVNVESTGNSVRVGWPGARGAGDPMFSSRAYLGGPGGLGTGTGGSGLDMTVVKNALTTLVSLPGKMAEGLNGSGFGRFLEKAMMGMLGKVKTWATEKLGLKDLLKMGGDLFKGAKNIIGKVVTPFDTGGLLKPGALGANFTGKPERVLDPRTTANFERLTDALGSGSLVGALTITNWKEGTGHFRLVARDEIDASAEFRGSLGRMR